MNRFTYLVITLLILSGVLIGALIGYDYGIKNNVEIIVNSDIIVKDSISLIEFKSFVKEDLTSQVDDKIEELVEKEFDRTTTMLNWSIVLFSIFLTVVLVFLGYFSITKISQVEKLVERTEKLPEVIFESYDQKKLNELIPLLNSSNPVKKNRAIIKISDNKQLKSEIHFDTLSKVYKDEFKTKSPFRRYNMLFLADTLTNLDMDKTIDLSLDLIIEHTDITDMDNIFPHIISSPLREHQVKLVETLTDPSNSKVSHLIINTNDFTDYVRLKTVLNIVKNGSANDVNTMMNAFVRRRKFINDFQIIIDNFGDELFVYGYSNNILSWLNQGKLIKPELVKNIMIRIISKGASSDQIARMITFLYSHVVNEDDRIKIIKGLNDEFKGISNIYDILRNDTDARNKEIMKKIDIKI